MARFYNVAKTINRGENFIPIRKTANSAGYDFVASEDIIVPSIFKHQDALMEYRNDSPIGLDVLKPITKKLGAKPTLIPTGVKCQMASDEYLELSVRSSCPLNYWLILANGVGIIDSDYFNNPDNEGEIFFQVINLSPIDIEIKKGDCIGQGILHKYLITEDDAATGERVGGFGSTSNV